MKYAETEFTFFVHTQEVREMVAPVLKSFQAQVSHMCLRLQILQNKTQSSEATK